MLGFGKKAAFAQLERCVDGVMLAMAYALFDQEPVKGDRGREAVARVLNLLLLRSLPGQTEEEKRAAGHYAARVLQSNEDIRHAVVMCLRALSVTRGDEFSMQAMRMIGWISNFGSLPTQQATYDNMHWLQWNMVKKYCPQAIQQ